MLRPATPLSILLFASFILLLITVLSTPIIRGIPLATYRGYNFGVFGYCQGKNGPCSGIKVGYTTDGLFGSDPGDFNLPANTRHSLSSLLIVHPVAAFCNLVVLGLAIAAHFHTPSHSARYLLALLILLLPTLLVTLLAFLVDILLFVPHVAWGGWIVLASTILITASGVVTCAMRRTLVSRKARKKRIAENAEMSGENFYTRQEQESKMAPIPTMSTESKVPLVNGGPGADNLPSFTTYDANRRQDERHLPNQSMQNASMTPVSPVSDENRYYGSSSRSNSRPPPGENGIPLAPINTQNSETPYRTSQEGRAPGPYGPNGYAARGGYGPPRGRGGFPPRGGFNPRGGYGPRGPPPQGYGRGGFSSEMRGGYGGRGRGGYPGAPVAAGVVGVPMMSGAAGGRPVPPPSYPPQGGDGSPDRYSSRDGFPGRNPSPYSRGEGTRYEPVSPSRYTEPGEATAGYAAYDQQNRSPTSIKAGSMHSRGQSPAGMRRSPSPPPPMPPPIGQAVEMGAGNGRTHGYDSDVQGMVDLQRNQRPAESPQGQSPQEYVPPRAQWNNSPGNGPAIMHHAATLSNPQVNRPRGNSNASGSYYEDVNPRFAEDTDSVSALPPRTIANVQHQQNQSPDGGIPAIPHTASYEDLPVGARSPAESETSHFTSVSQRGVNPNWRPGYGGEFSNLGPRRPQQPRQDMLLANNPDFELAPPQTRFGARGGRGGYRGSPMGVGAPGRLPPPSGMAVSGDSPYPGPTTMREI